MSSRLAASDPGSYRSDGPDEARDGEATGAGNRGRSDALGARHSLVTQRELVVDPLQRFRRLAPTVCLLSIAARTVAQPAGQGRVSREP